MKVGLLGNMNNILFTLARYLRDEGIDATLLLYNDEVAHFRPHNDCFEPADANTFVRSLSWGSKAGFSATLARQIADDLRPYDFLIGCGAAPAYVAKAGRMLDVFVPFGGDIYLLPFPSLAHPIRMPRSLGLIAAQRKAIEACPHIVFNATNPGFEKAVRKLRLRGQRHYHTPPMLYHKEYEPQRLNQYWAAHPHHELLDRLRAQHDVLIFQHARQNWRWDVNKWSRKGNDRLIHGLWQFLTNNPSANAHMVLLEYGWNVAQSKALIRSLGLDKHVTWLPVMSRKWIMTALPLMDVVVGELQHSWLTYGVVCEALCAGRPLMHKRTDAYYAAWYDELYPMIHAESTEEVTAGLQHVADNPTGALHTGDGGRAWLLEYGIRRPVQLFMDLINAAEKK